MQKHTKTVVIGLLKILFTLLIFYFISKRMKINPLVYFNETSIYYFAAALLLSISLIFLQTFRWKNIAKMFSITIPYKECLSAVWVGHLVNNVLPVATAGDLLRSYTLRKVDPQQRKWKWVSAFLSEKYSAAISALLIASLVMATSAANQLPNLLVALILLLCGGVLVAPFIITKLITYFDLAKITLILNYIQKITTQLADTFLNKYGRYAFIQSSIINFGMCLIFYTIAIGLGAQITFLQCLFVVPTFTLLTSLPISFAGWGIRELSCVGLLQFFGVPTETAVIISVMYGAIFFLSCIPGVFISYSFFRKRIIYS